MNDINSMRWASLDGEFSFLQALSTSKTRERIERLVLFARLISMKKHTT